MAGDCRSCHSARELIAAPLRGSFIESLPAAATTPSIWRRQSPRRFCCDALELARASALSEFAFLFRKERHNSLVVSSSLYRSVVTLILGPYLALSAMVAPEHIHQADRDHPHSAVHRHLQAHVVGSHDHDHAQLADDDGHVVWLDGVALRQTTYHFTVPSSRSAPRFELVQPVTGWIVAPDYNAAPPHGPPRASLSLRAPPDLFA